MQRSRRFRRRALVAFALIAMLGVGVATGRSMLTGSRDDRPMERGVSAGLRERWGVELESLRSTAAGYMLDFRYRVVDTQKAAPLFERRIKPYLVDQASGAKLGVPSPAKTGPLRNSNPPLADRTYFMFFANPAKRVKQGNKVTVVIGDFRAEDLIVQ